MSFPAAIPQTNSALSYRVPPAFSAFGRQRSTTPASNPATGELPPPIQDTFLDPTHRLSSKSAITWFLGGLATAMAGKGLFERLIKRQGFIPKSGPVGFKVENFKTQSTEQVVNEMNLAQSYDGLASVYMLALRDKSQRQGLMTYLGTIVLGYLSGSLIQGTQETWVRREETRIRAHLINRLKQVFRQSIQVKNTFDNRLKDEARTRVHDLLQRHGIFNTAAFLTEKPFVESDAVHQRYFYEPTHRSLSGASFNSPAFRGDSETIPESVFEQAPTSPWGFRLMKAGIFGAGLFTGVTLQAFLRLFAGHVENSAFPGRIINYETIRLEAQEALTIHGIANRQNMFIMAGFFALSAAAKLGKLFVDGLREIEVTRANAKTELSYQTHNWLSQDPAFHEIAETEALNHSLRQLDEDLPSLKANPALLHQRIRTILANVGRNSAPKYFPMTPPVGLVMARA